MLTVSKLNEALDYLTINTGRTWKESELLDCVMSTRIDIHAAAPATAQVSINTLGISDLVEKYRMPHGHTLLAILHPANAADLLVRGETLTSHPFNPSQSNRKLSVQSLAMGEIVSDVTEYHLFTEPVLVQIKDIRIRSVTLKLILDLWNDAQKDYPTLRGYPEWMKPVESLPVAQTENAAEVNAAPITQAEIADGETDTIVNDEKPWNIANPADPEPLQPWFTPARFFARKLVKDDSTLLNKRKLLAAKTSQSLFAARIFGRYKNKPLDAGTVEKAFNNISLG